MSEKYMKIKRVIIPTITMVVIASQLFACSSATKQETYNMLQDSTEIELEYAVPNYDIAEDSQVSLLPWLALGNIETHPEIRSQFEEYFNITGETGSKEGILYYNPITHEESQNVTLYMTIQNSKFRNSYIAEASMTAMGDMALENYTDIEADDVYAPYATINAYFDLLPDQEEAQFDGESTISRAQAMALVMRATTPVNDEQAPETNDDFTSKVGESQYTDFAAPMDEYSYITTKNGLGENSFTTAMSTGEYICMLTNYFRSDYLSAIEDKGYTDSFEDISDVTLSTVKNAGDITLTESIKDPTKGCPQDMYETFQLAKKMGLIQNEGILEDWDAALTKEDAIAMFVEMAYYYVANVSSGISVDDYDTNYDVYNNPDEHYTDEELAAMDEHGRNYVLNQREEKEIIAMYGSTEEYRNYAREQGADSTAGWCWEYYRGEGAGDQPSYCVYMNPDSPDYGKKYYVGDYLPNGSQFTGTNDELAGLVSEEADKAFEAAGGTIIETDDAVIYDLDSLPD